MTTPPYGDDADGAAADNPYASDPAAGASQNPGESPYGTSWHSPDAETPVSRPTPTGSSYAYTRGDALQGPYPPVRITAEDVRETRRSDNGGFFSALFDLNFDQFVSVRYAKFIYTLLLVLIALALVFLWLIPALTAFSEGIGVGFLVLILGWIPVAVVGLFQLIVVRILLEFVIATVRTSENTAKLVEDR